MVMYPGYKYLNILNDYKSVRKKIYKKVYDLALLHQQKKKSIDFETRFAKNLNFYDIDEVSCLGDESVSNIDEWADQVDVSSDDAVSDELDVEWRAYFNQNVSTYWRVRQNQKHILKWWAENTIKFPIMSNVAQCLLGSNVSSSMVEVDNGIAGMYIPRSRVSTATDTIEMKIFINRNKKFLDWNKIRELSQDERSSVKPPVGIVQKSNGVFLDELDTSIRDSITDDVNECAKKFSFSE